MTDRLNKVFAQVQQLPQDQQREIAELIERELADRAWDALFATPESELFLEQLVEEARREHAVGRRKESTDRW